MEDFLDQHTVADDYVYGYIHPASAKHSIDHILNETEPETKTSYTITPKSSGDSLKRKKDNIVKLITLHKRFKKAHAEAVQIQNEISLLEKGTEDKVELTFDEIMALIH